MLRRFSRPVLFVIAILAIIIFIQFLPNATNVASAPPAGFNNSLVTDVPVPIAMAFTPDNRLLITIQYPAQIWVYQNGALMANPSITIPGVCNEFERGVLGIAADPNFLTNQKIYVYYTYDKYNGVVNGNCPANTAKSPVNRVASYTLNPDNTINNASATVILDNIPSPNGNHNGGDMHFGPDGYLYISVGDGGCSLHNKNNCGGNNDNARYKGLLSGKILRITTTGLIPPTNPWVNVAGSRRCGNPADANYVLPTAGQVEATPCQETYMWGLRNPFRFAFKPDNSGVFYINDVGQDSTEEIDSSESGAGTDYGWNNNEGHCQNPNFGTTCYNYGPAGGMPIYDYDHDQFTPSCTSITGGAFVPPSAGWPLAYNNAYLFSDYVCGNIKRLVPPATQGGNYSSVNFDPTPSSGNPISMIFGPDGALYYTTFGGPSYGQVRKISYTAGQNNAPVASFTTNPNPPTGGAPLNVSFDASASTDPDDGTQLLKYIWDFGDGSPVVTLTTPTTSHTFTNIGNYTVTLKVQDRQGLNSAVVTKSVSAGNTPPVATISSPIEGFTYKVGQTFTLTGSATDQQDGTLPANKLCWVVLKHHDSHTHPFFPSTCGNNLTTLGADIPEGPTAPLTTYFEVILTVTDSQGVSTTVTRNIYPHLINITIDSSVGSIPMTLDANGTVQITTLPQVYTSMEGFVLTLDTPHSFTDANSNVLTFSRWSDGATTTQPSPDVERRTITTPGNDITLVAVYDGQACIENVVSNFTTTGCGSLPYALNAANPANGGTGVVSFKAGLVGNINLTNGLSLPAGVTIVGNCATNIGPQISITIGAGNPQPFDLQLGGNNTLIGLKIIGTPQHGIVIANNKGNNTLQCTTISNKKP